MARPLQDAEKLEMIKGLSIAYIPVASLLPANRNPRTHSDTQISQISRSIKEFGWTNPILIDEKKHIIAGHGRLAAARLCGVAEVPTIELSGLSSAQKRALVIADNKLALNAGWDDDLLTLELGELKDLDFDLSLIGFSDAELAGMLDTTEGLTDPDDVPEVQADAVTVLGDVWVMGRHRLVCGDSTTVEAVDAALAGVVPHLMVTDPPYGVEYDADWRNHALRADGSPIGGRAVGKVENDNRADGSPIGGRAVGKVENDNRADWTEAWALFPGDVAYVWHGALHASEVASSLEASGFVVRSQVIWAKQQFAIGRGHYHWQHEPCWYVVRDKATGHWSGDRKQTTLWQIDKPKKSETGHSTQKPVECMKRPIENNSSPGQAVYEPFSGSGTTIVAGEMTGRCVHAIELSPQYVDVAVKRWQAFTGQEATLEQTGRTFAETEAARLEHVHAA